MAKWICTYCDSPYATKGKKEPEHSCKNCGAWDYEKVKKDKDEDELDIDDIVMTTTLGSNEKTIIDEIMGFIPWLVIPLIIGLAGTWIFNLDDDTERLRKQFEENQRRVEEVRRQSDRLEMKYYKFQDKDIQLNDTISVYIEGGKDMPPKMYIKKFNKKKK